MNSDGQYISVMKGKSQAFWIVLAGVFLAARVCDAECIKLNFKAHITDHLLIDHWFQMKNFTPTGEEVKEQHELLSVINTICSSFLANEMFYHPNPINKTIQTKVVWTYLQMVKALVNASSWNDTVQFCQKHSCFESFGTSFINTTQFENMYKKVCKWKISIPECPFPQSTTTATSHTSTPTAPEPREQTSSESPNENISKQPIKSDVQNPESQCVSSGLVVSVVVNIILMILVSVGLYHQGRRYLRPVQDQNNRESHTENVDLVSLNSST
ncbi:hypothetical protein PHYPO_G00039710 [Pangasianodon hypophthalmus]|uniref:Uncharacterized protein n=1 Tax=Pangasianodon hypophthalmus TaxID=310915 RepID=A0A5N5MEH1_PANHP|nr:uncharacterized protein LOC113525295 [Pangasianodon hypophthalmus]KAB5553530.1 hypothetical protein PHYPO_G00039710 [Pangasianodon hypophthalmus]